MTSMLPPITFVGLTANELTPAPMRLPPVAWSAFALFGRVHSAWRWFRHAELYGNPRNFTHLLAGHIVDYVVGDRFFVRMAAHSLMVATRLLECAQAQAAVHQSGQELMHALLGRYPLLIKEEWPTARTETFGLSPSTVAWWRTSPRSAMARASRIGLCALKLAVRTFELSMRIADAVDAFYLPPDAHSHSVAACFVHAAKLVDALAENKEELLEGLADNKALIGRIIEHSPFTYEQLYQAASSALGKVETACYYSDKVSDFTGNTTAAFGKRVLNGGMVVAGLGDYRPAWLTVEGQL